MEAVEVRQQLGPAIWNDYFKFTIVRNPYDKLVSAFYMAKTFDAVMRREDSSNDPRLFRQWLQNGGGIDDRLAYTIDGSICVDYFIRYEILLDGVAEVCKQLLVPLTADFHFKKLTRGPPDDFNS